MHRRGVTLIELLITMVVVSILGTGLVRMLISNSRFVSRQDALMDARQTARAAANVMVSELRTVSDSGLIAATPTSVVVRAPYAFGITCRPSPGVVIAAAAPTDSAIFASGSPSGLAWRVGSSGQYVFVPGVSVAQSSNFSACSADSIRVLPGGRLLAISTGADTIPPGTIFYLYQNVRYAFAPSAALPGRIGLWRQAGTGADEELSWPFDATAGFAFLVGTSLTPQATPPADLTTVSALELRLAGQSALVARGDAAPRTFDLRTRVPLMNVVQ